jgi:predicted nucleic acid-binding protein
LWVDYFRKKTPAAVKAQVDSIIRGADVATCAPILFELLRAVSQKEGQKIEEFFATIPVLETPDTLWADSSRLGQKCAAAGLLTPAIDLLIAQICIHHDVPITTFDEDFKKIASVSRLRLNLLTRPVP